MKRILAMSKPNAVCAIHGATADGFFKGSKFSDFDFAGLFSSAFFLPALSPRTCCAVTILTQEFNN
ncbi:hypothetical protein [Fibrobacter sp. UWP2]|uniref:hypothetical protein n=1 Tax=Fibrobacter sp. UWP2 TaxID=1896216 RepID=UPI001160AC4D|nr:hypothetical protein [Fibrobacter sp. UWP2]